MKKYLKEIGRYKLLTREEETKLAYEVQNGNSYSKEKLINSNLRLVVSIAKKYVGRGVNFRPSTYNGKEMFVGKDEFINMMTVSSLTTGFTGYDELFVDIKGPLDNSLSISVEQFMSNVTTACFRDGSKAYIVVANSSDSEQSFLISNSRLGRTDSVVKAYDEKGRLINERKMRSNLRHILQPGEFVIIEVEIRG